VQLSQTHIDTLGPHAKPLTDNKSSVVVIIGPHNQNNALASKSYIKENCEERFNCNIFSNSLQNFW